MKEKLGFLIVIILFLTSSVRAQETSLPNEVIANVVDELIIKDRLVIRVFMLDSLISVYEHQHIVDTIKVRVLKQERIECDSAISALQKISAIDSTAYKAAVDKERNTGNKKGIGGVVLGVLLTLLLIAL